MNNLWYIIHTSVLYSLHDFPRFTKFGIIEVEHLFSMAKQYKKYKRVIFVPLASPINAYAMRINSDYFSTNDIGVVPFTLEQNYFILKHVLKFPNITQMSKIVVHLHLMIPFYMYTAILALTTVIKVSSIESYAMEYAS